MKRRCPIALPLALFLLCCGTAKKAEAQEPDDAYDVTAEAELALRYDRCLDAVNLLIEKEREDSLGSYQYALLARAFACLGSHQAAVDVYTSLLKKEPGNTGFIYNRAVSYAADGRMKKAFESCRKLQLLAPKDTFYCLSCGGYAYEVERYGEAQGWVERRLQQSPDDGEAQLLLAKILLHQKDFNRALLLVNAYAAGNPTDADGLLLRAQLYEQTQMQQFASTDYQAYLQANPHDHKTRVAYGNLLVRMNRAEEACGAFDAAKRHGSLDAGKLLYKHCGRK